MNLAKSLAWLALVSGCWRGGGRDSNEATTEHEAAFRAFGATAEQQAAFRAYVMHDSLVIDSLSRFVNTDSLYRLNRLLADARDPKPLVIEAMCEKTRLMFRHGVRPSDIALRRMSDTLWKPWERDLPSRIEARMPTATALEVSDQTCGYLGRPVGDTVAGVSTTDRPSFVRWRSQQQKP